MCFFFLPNFFLFLVVGCHHADENQLVRRQTFDLDIVSPHGTLGVSKRPGTFMIYGARACRRIPTLLSLHVKKNSPFFNVRDRSSFFLVCFLQTSGQFVFTRLARAHYMSPAIL